jgi:hypothetical protein
MMRTRSLRRRRWRRRKTMFSIMDWVGQLGNI